MSYEDEDDSYFGVAKSLFDRSELFGDEMGNGRFISIIYRNPRMFGPKSETKIKFKAGIITRDLEEISTLMAKGKPNREISRLMGVSEKRCRRIRLALETERGSAFLCACGQLASHKTYCPIMAGKVPKKYKLTPEIVRECRRAYQPHKVGCDQLAKRYGVNTEVMRAAIFGETFARVQNPGPLRKNMVAREQKKRDTLAKRFLRRGWSIRRVAREAGVHRDRVREFAAVMKHSIPFPRHQEVPQRIAA